MRDRFSVRHKVVLAFLLAGSVLALTCCAAGVEITRRIVSSRRFELTLNRLGWAIRTIEQVILSEDKRHLENTIANVRRTLGARYCVVLDSRGATLAAAGSIPSGWQPGTDSRSSGEISCETLAVGGLKVTVIDVPIHRRGERAGRLIVGLAEPGLATFAWEVLRQPPLLLVLPVALCLGSGLWLSRTLSGVAIVSEQLGELSTAGAIEPGRLQTVPAKDRVAVGWNRLVTTVQTGEARTGSGGVENALRDYGQSRYFDVLASLPDAIAVTDVADRLRYANGAFEHLTGEKQRDLRGRRVAEILNVPGESLARSEGEMASVSRPLTFEVTRRHDDREQVLRLQRVPVRGTGSDTVVGFAWIARDVTQQKIAERMKMQFMYSAIHELRTPLSNIRAYAETLAALDDINVEKQKEFCNIIATEAVRLARLIDDLLNLSSMDAGAMCVEKVPTDVARLVEDVIVKMRPGAEEKKLQFTAELPDKYFPARLDKQKIAVALVNILGNAIKYTPPGGSVTFRVAQTESELQFVVEDTGIGIAEEDLPHIFNRFYRARDERVEKETGSGIGLALAREIVELHGGTISVRSVLNEGSTFTIRVPCNG